MSEIATDHRENAGDVDENEVDVGGDAATPYADAVEEYLAEASWLAPADVVYKVHARNIAKSLDRQLERNGEVQSALASSFDKVLVRLEARRPQPPAISTGAGDGGGGYGETPSIFGAGYLE